MGYTYRDLLEFLTGLDSHELDMTATVYLPDMDEFVPLARVDFSDSTIDVLDEGHPFMIVKND
jgi:hypothetical protein